MIILSCRFIVLSVLSVLSDTCLLCLLFFLTSDFKLGLLRKCLVSEFWASLYCTATPCDYFLSESVDIVHAPTLAMEQQQRPFQRMPPPSLNPLAHVPNHPKAPSPMRRGDAIDVYLTPEQMHRGGNVAPLGQAPYHPQGDHGTM